MDRSSSNSSSDEPTGTEKKMKVAEEDLVLPSCDKLEGADKCENDKMTSNGNDKATVQNSTHQPPLPPPANQNANQSESNSAEAAASSNTEISADNDNGSCADAGESEEKVELKVVFNKKPLLIKISLKKTVGDLKSALEKLTNVTPALQKVLIKGIAKDSATLESLGVTNLTKVLVIGSKLSDVMDMMVKPTDKEGAAKEDSSSKETNNWCTLTQHKKVIDKGVPEDAMPGILNENEPLPDIPLFGMLNSKGSKLRLTFKLELDELWIGTKERTEKVPIGSIRNIDSQPITGYEHYHIMAIQLGPTEASRYFVYWVPAQYIDAIKDALSN